MNNAAPASKSKLDAKARLWNKARAFARNVALSHSLFALPFAYVSLVLASDGAPSAGSFFWVTLAMVAARSAALSLNNLIDLRYDRLQPRFRGRPMVTGEIGRTEAVAFIALCTALFLWGAAHLHPVCIRLAPVPLLFFAVYPYIKRFSWTCHLFLGATLALAPLASWLAIKGTLAGPVVILALAVAAWIAGFDIVYGCLDVKFDRENNLHSIPVTFGVGGALAIARTLHAVSLAGFAAFGALAGLGPLYYGGVGAAAAVLYYQHRIVSPVSLIKVTQTYFLRNGLVGIAIFIFTLLSIV